MAAAADPAATIGANATVRPTVLCTALTRAKSELVVVASGEPTSLLAPAIAQGLFDLWSASPTARRPDVSGFLAPDDDPFRSHAGGAVVSGAVAMPRSAEQILTTLSDAVHGGSSPFACGGSLLLGRPPALVFKVGARIVVAPADREYAQREANQPLLHHCRPARFGHGRRTRDDREVRDALQLDAAGGAFTVADFDPADAGLREQVRRTLAPEAAGLRSELYALNVYNERGHFRSHKDTPRGEDMLGSLVVCLASRFHGRDLVLMHRGAHRAYDWAEAIARDPDPNRIHWAAFFGDVDHAIDGVWGGSRVTLTYLLRRDAGPPLEDRNAREGESYFAECLADALRRSSFLARGGTLAFPCFHMYAHDARWQIGETAITEDRVTGLKGRDLVVGRASLRSGLDVTLVPYLVETCADETWVLHRFPSKRERGGLGHRVEPDDLERALPLASEGGYEHDPRITRVSPPPSFNGGPHLVRIAREAAAADPDLITPAPALDPLRECEYSATGYFGNESSPTEFYVYAALHVKIPRAGTGARAGIPSAAVRRPRSRRSARA